MFKTSRLIILLALNSQLRAEVITDGTLGTPLNLPGPNFQIEANLGQPVGSNLFHSFQDFNLQSHESATFSGSNSVQNIISRVTGGNPSHINGLIRSTIPHADMYFLNPYGIMFGPHAKLDVQGSFHASTADYLRLGDSGEFNARLPNNSLLTVAPIEAFGFINDSPATLSIEGSQLRTPFGKTFSLVGGDLTIKNAQLVVPNGQLNLASVAQTGQVSARHPETSAFEQQGTITLSEHTHFNVDGVGAGEVFIRGGQLVMHDSVIQANTLADQTGKGIDMKLTESVHIKGDLLAILNNTFGSGAAGQIAITTPRLEIVGSMIDSSSFGTGHAGNIEVKAKQVLLEQGSVISSDSFVEDGESGHIRINTTGSLSISGQRQGILALPFGRDKKDNASQISSDTYGSRQRPGDIVIMTDHLNLTGGLIGTNGYGKSQTGDITIQANTINLTGGALISTTAFAGGNGGKMQVTAEQLSISGRRDGLLIISSGTFENNQSGIVSLNFKEGQAGDTLISAVTLILDEEGSIAAATLGDGMAGDVVIEVEDFYLLNGGQINNSNAGFLGEQMLVGRGDGGAIQVKATGDITIVGHSERDLASGLFTHTGSSGQGGNIEVQAHHLKVSDGGEISAKSLNIGNAGKIRIQAEQIHLTNKGNISTSAEHATGGDIIVTMSNLLYLREGEITTSVGTGVGQGGDITIDNPSFIVLDASRIVAQADEGQGGNIRLVADHFLQTPNSLLSASSRLGVDGEIIIESPDETVDGKLLVLPTGFIDVSGLLPQPCQAMTLAEYLNRSSFMVNRIAGSSLLSPFDLKPSHALISISNARPPISTISSTSHPAKATQQLAFLTGCYKL